MRGFSSRQATSASRPRRRCAARCCAQRGRGVHASGLRKPGGASGGRRSPRPLVALGRRRGKTVLWLRASRGLWRLSGRALPGDMGGRWPGRTLSRRGRWRRCCFSAWCWAWPRRCRASSWARAGRCRRWPFPTAGTGRRLPPEVLAEAVRHLEACYPEEGCGVVLQGAAGARWVALPNAYAGVGRARPRRLSPRCAERLPLRPGAVALAAEGGGRPRRAASVRGARAPGRPGHLLRRGPGPGRPFAGSRCCPGWPTWWWPSKRDGRERRPGCTGRRGASSQMPLALGSVAF